MISRLRRLSRTIGLSIERHGGGLAGLYAVARRSVQMTRALGIHGVIARLRAAARTPMSAPPPVDAHAFPAPAPLDRIQLKVGVMLHLFYPDLLDEFAEALAAMPVPYTLLVSVTDPDAVAQVETRFRDAPALQRLRIEVVPNRGRDLAPFLSTFRDDIMDLDVVAHLHSKKSLYTGSAQDAWRQYLVHALLGTPERIAWQLGMFVAEPRLGLVYPDSYEGVPLWAHTWLSNLDIATTLAARLDIGIRADGYLDVPMGAMFWARVNALRPLFDLQLSTEDFPEEAGQTDGTVQHALERLLVPVARSTGHVTGVLPGDGTLALTMEGGRNWQDYFALPLRDRIATAALDAELVSLDVFDTLVVRPFLSPDAARNCLARLVEVQLGVPDFVSLRARAEDRARVAADGRDPCLHEIYRAMAQLQADRALPTDAMLELEVATEARWLRPRTGVIDALSFAARGKRLVALSDMYMDAATLAHVLPRDAAQLPQAWYVSCETGWRKDRGDVWQALPRAVGVAPGRWLHVGDNERSDVQVPQWHGLLTPVHVLRPAALLEVVPGLRALRPRSHDGAWQDALWLGLVANHFADLANVDPSQLAPGITLSPDSLGYCVLGPLVLDYLTWLRRIALERGARRVLFLSREGHLLQRAYEYLCAAIPTSGSPVGEYFLASRQATGLASPSDVDQLRDIFTGTYNGTFEGLLRARLGSVATDAIRPLLDRAVLGRQVFLPEMADDIVAWLGPAHDALFRLSAAAREAYRAYWREHTLDEPVLLADIGYSGSIQRNLSRMLGCPLDGAYFALNARANVLADAGWATARYHDGRHAPAGDSLILRHDLLLESVLTAPAPQFAGFAMEGDLPVPRYAAADTTPEQWAVIALTHQGALRFVENACAAAGPLAGELGFSAEAVQIPLSCVGSGTWRAPWLQKLGVDDAFTGRGAVPATTG